MAAKRTAAQLHHKPLSLNTIDLQQGSASLLSLRPIKKNIFPRTLRAVNIEASRVNMSLLKAQKRQVDSKKKTDLIKKNGRSVLLSSYLAL